MKRISFNVNEKVYEKLISMLGQGNEEDSVSSAVKAMLYAMVQEPIELSSKEIDRIERIQKRRDELAKLEQELKKSRSIPVSPFDQKPVQAQSKAPEPKTVVNHKSKAPQQKPAQKPQSNSGKSAFIKQKPQNGGIPRNRA